MRWIDVKGPIAPQWPAAPYAVLFDDLPVKPTAKGSAMPYAVTPRDANADAERLLRRFVRAAYRRPVSSAGRDPFPAGHPRRAEVWQLLRRGDALGLRRRALLAVSSSTCARPPARWTTTRWRRA